MRHYKIEKINQMWNLFEKNEVAEEGSPEWFKWSLVKQFIFEWSARRYLKKYTKNKYTEEFYFDENGNEIRE